MTHDSVERTVWLRVAGMLALTLAYLSMRGRIAGLDSLYRTIIVAGVAIAATALVVVWRVDRSRGKRVRPLLIFGLTFAVYAFSVLYLWDTAWGVVPHAMFVLALVLGPLLILRRARQ